jgi:hypothetical protein
LRDWQRRQHRETDQHEEDVDHRREAGMIDEKMRELHGSTQLGF